MISSLQPMNSSSQTKATLPCFKVRKSCAFKSAHSETEHHKGRHVCGHPDCSCSPSCGIAPAMQGAKDDNAGGGDANVPHPTSQIPQT
eukprot:6456747-Amphidinium_carterae.1